MRIAFMAGIVASCLADSARAQDWSFFRVADSNSVVPGDSGVFTTTGNRPFDEPSLGSDGKIVVRAQYNNTGNREGIFSNRQGPFSVVANRNAVIPGSTLSFASLVPGTSYDGASPTFAGGNGAQGGIYALQNGQFTTIVNEQSLVPGGSGTFGTFGGPSIDGAIATFGGQSGPQNSLQGVYKWSSATGLSLVVDSNTPHPAGGSFASLGGTPQLSSTKVAFGGGNGSRNGLYLADLSVPFSFDTIVDSQTAIPGGTGNFLQFVTLSNSAGNVAFVGQDSQLRTGVYARLNGQLVNIADTLHAGPQGRQFGAFYSVAISGNSIAFTAGATGFGTELWVWRNGEFSRVVGRGDVLNGITVGVGGPTIFIGPEALRGDSVAFSFADGNIGTVRGGVYTATYIPAPGPALAFGLAGIFTARRRRRLNIQQTCAAS